MTSGTNAAISTNWEQRVGVYDIPDLVTCLIEASSIPRWRYGKHCGDGSDVYELRIMRWSLESGYDHI